MYKRLIPLALAQVGDGSPIKGRTRLQKMVFVIQRELEDQLRDDQKYEFFAYNYGPFSKELAEDIDDMIEADLIEEDPVEYDDEGNLRYEYTIKSDGSSLLDNEGASEMAREVTDLARQIKERYNEDLSLPEVIDEVYAEHPDMAKHSIY